MRPHKKRPGAEPGQDDKSFGRGFCHTKFTDNLTVEQNVCQGFFKNSSLNLLSDCPNFTPNVQKNQTASLAVLDAIINSAWLDIEMGVQL